MLPGHWRSIAGRCGPPRLPRRHRAERDRRCSRPRSVPPHRRYRQAYVDAFAKDFDDDDAPDLEPAKVDCLGNAFLDVIGLDRITAAGVTPEEFGNGLDASDDVGIDEQKASDLYDTFKTCDVDLKALLAETVTKLAPRPLTADQRACIDDVLTEANLRKSFVADTLD